MTDRAVMEGKVLVVTRAGKIVPLGELNKYARPTSKVKAKGASAQLRAEEKWLGVKSLHRRVYNPSDLLDLYENNPTFGAVVDQIAVDVIASGWFIGPKDENTDAPQAEIDAGKEFFEGIFEFPWTVQRLTKHALTDWGVFGYWGIEVTRNGGGEPDGLFHVPAQTLWIYDRKKDDGSRDRRYAQRRGRKTVWFKPFGEERTLRADTGEPVQKSVNPANELLFYWEPHPRSEHYGLPRVTPSIGTVLGLIYARDYDLAFFENHGIPAFLIKLKGSWAEGASKKIEDFIRDTCADPSNSHRTMVLQLPRGKDPKDDGDILIEPVETIETKEGAFRMFKRDSKRDIMSNYSIPPERIGQADAGKLGGNMAEEANKIYNTSTVQPLQTDIAAMFTLLLRVGLGHTTTAFFWNPLDLRDREAEIKRYERLFGIAVRSPNDIAEALGYDRVDDPAMDQYYILKKYAALSDLELVEADDDGGAASDRDEDEEKTKLAEALEEAARSSTEGE